MFARLKPCMTAKNAYDIDYKALRRENIRLVMFDIDNTLVPHSAPASQKAKDLIENLKNMGFRVVLLSNAKESRVKPFAKAVKTEYAYKAGKPKPESYRKALKSCRARPEHAVYIGDQLFTDILGANRAGMISCLVDPIDRREGLEIRIKRPFEKIVSKLLKIK